MACQEVTTAFSYLNDRPSQQQVQDAMLVLERFVIIIYDRTSPCECVNEARKVLFSQKGRTLESIPPTSDALIQHTKRVAYQAGHCWDQCRGGARGGRGARSPPSFCWSPPYSCLEYQSHTVCPPVPPEPSLPEILALPLGQCLIPIPELRSPSEWGWIKSDSGSWQPLWTTIPQA